MFALRGLAISMCAFSVVYSVASLGVLLGWKRVAAWLPCLPPHRRATMLFTLRLFPLAGAILTTAFITVPSFLLFEPRSVEESLSPVSLGLAVLGLFIAVASLVSVWRAVAEASRVTASWIQKSSDTFSLGTVPVIRIAPDVPALAAVGIIRSRIFLSESAGSVLSPGELRTALQHEVVHLQRRDNLKKLLVRAAVFPGMRSLEAAWLDALEIAADDAAVTSRTEALDLAAAIIKLSRIIVADSHPDLATGLVCHSSTNDRVQRLLRWNAESKPASGAIRLRYGIAALLATSAVFAFTYGQLLGHVHTATEWLVR